MKIILDHKKGFERYITEISVYLRTDTPDALQTGRPIDWEDTMEWNCLHFAVKYHIQSLEVLNLTNILIKMKNFSFYKNMNIA